MPQPRTIAPVSPREITKSTQSAAVHELSYGPGGLANYPAALRPGPASTGFRAGCIPVPAMKGVVASCISATGPSSVQVDARQGAGLSSVGGVMSFSWEVLTDPPGFGTSTMLLLTDGRVICLEDGTANWSALTPDAHGSYWSRGAKTRRPATPTTARSTTR